MLLSGSVCQWAVTVMDGWWIGGWRNHHSVPAVIARSGQTADFSQMDDIRVGRDLTGKLGWALWSDSAW